MTDAARSARTCCPAPAALPADRRSIAPSTSTRARLRRSRRSAVSAMLRVCVTTWQNSTAEPSTQLRSSGSFHVHHSPDGLCSRTYGFFAGTARPRFANVQPNVLTPMMAMLRIRSCSTRTRPSRSNAAWPCAHVSIWRALMQERTLMSGPAHFTRCAGSSAEYWSATWRENSCQRCSSSCPAQPRSQTRVYSAIERPDASDWEMLSQKDSEGLRTFDRQARRVVEHVQVAQHVVQRPALELRRPRPLSRVDVGQQRVQRVTLVAIVDCLSQHREHPFLWGAL